MNELKVGTKLLLFFGGLTAKVVYRGSDGVIIETPRGRLFKVDPVTMKDHEGDVWKIDRPTPTYTYQNIYSNGFGRSEHRTEETAFHATQYGRIRLGYLKRGYVDHAVVSEEIVPTEPRLRDHGVEPHNPYADAA